MVNGSSYYMNRLKYYLLTIYFMPGFLQYAHPHLRSSKAVASRKNNCKK